MRADNAISARGGGASRGRGRERPASAGLTGFFRRQAEFASGCLIWLFAAFTLFSLATWNAGDPSWSHANDALVRNAMGYPGAVFADLAMQFFGVAALPAMLPLVFWGHARIRGHAWDHAMRRLAIWPVAAVLSAAAIGCLPVTATWALPTGLGGVAGDMALRLPGMLTGGYPAGWLKALCALLMFPAAVYALAVSCGFLWREPASDEIDEEDEDQGAGRLVTLGAVIHAGYTLRSALRRAVFGSRKSQVREAAPPRAAEPGGRVEPDFSEAYDDEFDLGVDDFDGVEDDVARADGTGRQRTRRSRSGRGARRCAGAEAEAERARAARGAGLVPGR